MMTIDTQYENYFFCTKNDINIQMLSEFEYSSEKRLLENGKTQMFYICRKDGCNREFQRTGNLLDHVRMHSGIKPHSCQFCGRKFTQK